MKSAKRRARWSVAGGILLAVAVLLPWQAPAHAQAQPVKDTKSKIYTNKNSFRMPVKIDDAVRAALKEVRLYVKNGQADWVQEEAAQPSVQFFNYHVPQDGEYWFSVATVDKAGRMTPPDVSKEAPGLQVVVDTTLPMVELKPWSAPDGELCLHCLLRDAHPDYQSIKITYRSADQVERILEAHPMKAGLFHVPEPEIWGSMARISAADRCGNQLTRDMRLPALPGSGPAGEPAGATPTNTPPNLHKSSYQAPRNQVSAPLKAVPPSAMQDVSSGQAVPPPLPKIPAIPESVGPINQQKASAGPEPMSMPSGRQLLNTTHAALEYRIDQVGPSGVGRVEVWITADNGTTWQRLGEDSDRHSPADVDLPGEGLFGLRLVVSNGNGFGGSAPKRGDAPTTSIEVDTTPPFVKLRDIDPVTDGGTLEIRWNASDKNLAGEPITIYFRTRPDGPWQVVARNLKNDGSYRWTFPHDLGSQFFFRIEAVDQAGNVARAETANAVSLDMTEPRAYVVGITGISPAPR